MPELSPSSEIPSPPVEATLTRVDYDLRINSDLASGRASLTVDVLKDGWVRVPIPVGLLVREARLDGKLVSLVPGAGAKAGGQLSALLSHPGRGRFYCSRLHFLLPRRLAKRASHFLLPPLASLVPPSKFLAKGVDIRLTGGLLSEKSETPSKANGSPTVAETKVLTFTWRRKTRTIAPLSLCACAVR